MESGKKGGIGVLLDEIDGLSNGERGGLSELHTYLRNAEVSQGRPLILISNSIDSRTLQQIAKVCLTFEITSVAPEILTKWLDSPIPTTYNGDLRSLKRQIAGLEFPHETVEIPDGVLPVAEWTLWGDWDPLLDFDIENNTLTISYNGTLYELAMISMDIDTGVVIVENIPFLPEESQGIKVGNVFYNQGLVVLTRDTAVKLLNEWQLDYKSTQTIYEHEYLLIVNEDEFNVSTNPSAIVEIGRETLLVPTSDGKIIGTTTSAGVKYIRKKSILENGNILDYRFSGSVTSSVTHDYIKAGFEHYELSSSMDSTGSFLSPFITTVGLYDDDCQLVAVAKLPQPIKSEPDIPVNFIIRFDT
jgi:hypothetical protein